MSELFKSVDLSKSTSETSDTSDTSEETKTLIDEKIENEDVLGYSISQIDDVIDSLRTLPHKLKTAQEITIALMKLGESKKLIDRLLGEQEK